MGAAEILVSGGVAAVLAAVAGGGLKAFGVELPLLASVKRQALVMIAGAGLIALGLLAGSGLPGAPPDARPEAAKDGEAPADDSAGAAKPGNAGSSPAPTGPPPAPDMLGMGFPEARRLIVDGGWSPIPQGPAPSDNPALGTRGGEVEARGWREAAFCGGTGRGACLLRYRQRGHVLEVVVVGDTLESGIVDMYDVIGCDARQRPEGCEEV